MSLNNFSLCLMGTGNHDKALEAITDAYTMFLTLAETQPATYTPMLVATMYQLATCLDNTG